MLLFVRSLEGALRNYCWCTGFDVQHGLWRSNATRIRIVSHACPCRPANFELVFTRDRTNFHLYDRIRFISTCFRFSLYYYYNFYTNTRKQEISWRVVAPVNTKKIRYVTCTGRDIVGFPYLHKTITSPHMDSCPHVVWARTSAIIIV